MHAHACRRSEVTLKMLTIFCKLAKKSVCYHFSIIHLVSMLGPKLNELYIPHGSDHLYHVHWAPFFEIQGCAINIMCTESFLAPFLMTDIQGWELALCVCTEWFLHLTYIIFYEEYRNRGMWLALWRCLLLATVKLTGKLACTRPCLGHWCCLIVI